MAHPVISPDAHARKCMTNVEHVPLARFCLTGWNNGSGGLGLRISRIDRDRLLRPLKHLVDERRCIIVELPGMDPVRVKVSPSFWLTCPEFRSADIGNWRKQRHEYPWRGGNPPKYTGELLTGISGNPRIVVKVPPLARCAGTAWPRGAC